MAKRSLRVRDLANAMASLAPPNLAASWDNVGLLVGDPQAPCARVLVTIDCTNEVLEEGLALQVQAIIAYHPPLFEPIRKLVAQDPRTDTLFRAARNGIALLSPHTALDAATGGVNDWLADGLGDGVRRPLKNAQQLPGTEAFKIVTFAPAEALDRIRGAMSVAGAGRIGDYSQCSQASAVEGTFFGGSSTHPRTGRRGRLERVAELRIEMVCGPKSLPASLAALRAAHPYEAPAIEVHALDPKPSAHEGEGRLVNLARGATARELARRLKRHLNASRMECASGTASPTVDHEIIGLCAGSGMSMCDAAIDAGATLFFTGEAKHHEILAANRRGCSVLICGHTVSERGYLPTLAQRIAPRVPGMAFAISQRDQHPLCDI